MGQTPVRRRSIYPRLRPFCAYGPTPHAQRPTPHAPRYLGCFLHFVACSYPYTSMISFPSLHARPKKVIPAGRAFPRVYPIGTVIAGKPVVGENPWLLSPAGVLRSPINRGGLLQV